MKKLLVAEMVAIALSIAIVVIGSIMGWSNQTTPVAFIVFTIAAAVASASAANFAAAVALADAAAVIFGAALATSTGLDAFIAAAAVIVTAAVAGIFGIFAVVENPKIKYRWAFLNLLGGGIIVWAVLHYGPSLLR